MEYGKSLLYEIVTKYRAALQTELYKYIFPISEIPTVCYHINELCTITNIHYKLEYFTLISLHNLGILCGDRTLEIQLVGQNGIQVAIGNENTQSAFTCSF